MNAIIAADGRPPLVPLFTRGGSTIYQGDAADVLRQLPSNIADCSIFSPPYWALRNYDVHGQIGLEETPAQYIDRLVDVFRAMHKVLKDDGTLWVIIDDTYAAGSAKRTGRTAKNLLLIPQRLMMALQDAGLFIVRSEILWEKPNAMPESCKDRPTRSHEYIYLLTNSARYYFNPDPLRETCVTGNGAAQGVIRGKRFGGKAQAQSPVSGHGQRVMYNNPKGRSGRTVWRINTEPCHGGHPAVFPRELVRRCLLAGCPEGGLVIDPFFGTGTVAEVAIELNRQCIGIDLNPKYLAYAQQRIQKALAEHNGTASQEAA